MSGFATLHCRLAFPIFRTSTDFSVLALAIRRRASAQILVWAAQRPYSHSSDRLTPIDRAVAPSPPIGLTNSMHLRHAPYTLWALSVIVSPANNGGVGHKKTRVRQNRPFAHTARWRARDRPRTYLLEALQLGRWSRPPIIAGVRKNQWSGQLQFLPLGY